MAGGQCARDHQERGAGAARARAPARERRSKRYPAQAKPAAAKRSRRACAAAEGAGSIPLPLTPGTQTKILPSGLAAAGEEAPRAVKDDGRRGQPPVRRELPVRRRARHIAETRCSRRMTAHRRSPTSCTRAACSATYAEDSTELESYGEPGPGRYVSIYANAGARLHVRRRVALRHRRSARIRHGPELGQARPKLARLPIRPRLGDLDRPPPTGPMRRARHESAHPRLPAARRRGARGMHQPRRAQRRAEHDIEQLAAERRRAAGARTAVASAQAPAGVQPTPAKALAAFAELYSTGPTARSAQTSRRSPRCPSARRAWPSSRPPRAAEADTTIARGHIYNTRPDRQHRPRPRPPGQWVIVTREQTGGDTQYEGLPAAYHVTLAQLASVPGGYAVSQWLPQS